MNTTTRTLAPALPARAPWLARRALQPLNALQVGTLDLQLPDGSRAHFGRAQAAAPQAKVSLDDWGVLRAALLRGDIGFAEAYVDGRWHSPDLVALLRLILRNRDALEALVHGQRWSAWLDRLRHALNRNTRRGSRRNILSHYDLGNDFYALWLDATMNYSSAWFDGDYTRPTAQAQQAKIDRALRECGLRPGQRLLEVGCGWGALAARAAQAFEARVVGVTLSDAQLAWGRQRVADEGLGQRVDLRLQDYRDIDDGPFDAIVSIEMFEAVGETYWDSYFATLARLLAPSGRACIQSITIRDDLFDRYRRSTDFIQQQIFPGGMLPSRSVFRAQAERAGFKVVGELAFGPDYAETLRRWRADFMARQPQVRALGFDDRFARLWEFYLAYCEAAFDEGSTDVVQFTLQRA